MNKPTHSDEESEKYLTLVSMVIARSWKDSNFKKRLIAHPKAVMKEEGFTASPDVKIHVVENSDKVRYIPLSRSLDLEKDIHQIKFVLSNLLPIQVGNEVRLVQSTEKARYLVIPKPPTNVDLDSASQSDLFKLAIAEGTTTSVTVTDVVTNSQITTVIGPATVVVGINAVVDVVTSVSGVVA